MNRGELVSLSKRMGSLQGFRFGLVGLVLLAAVLTPDVIGSSIGALAPASLAYAALSAAAELLRRAGGRPLLRALSTMLLVDGLYLAWVMHLTGGVESPLRFLVPVHVVAVSLLASYRSGLKIALWHSLMIIAIYEAQTAGLLGLPVSEQLPRIAAFHVTALWVAAVVTALFSGLNERELRRRRGDLEAMQVMVTELEHAATPRDVAEVLLDRVQRTFGFRAGLVVAVRDRKLEVLASTVAQVPGPPSRPDPFLKEAWKDREPLLVRALDPARAPWLAAAMPGASNVAVFPMIAEGRPIGAVILERGGLPRVERRVILTAEQFVAHGALVLRNAWLLERVQTLAERDPMTGVYNRRTFERELARNLAHSRRSGERVTLAMIDVDHFKKHNDRYGHQAGDEVLRGVAAALGSAVRSFDTVARYGGEEFAVIMPGLSHRESLAAVERLREAIAATPAAAPVTASAGVATFPANARDAESLLRAADEALYASKAAGRDRSTRSRRRGGLRAVPSGRRAG